MIVQKVLNHNAAVVMDHEEEKVAIGSGIAFQKKKHDIIDPEKIEKLFVLSRNQDSTFTDLLEKAGEWETDIIQDLVYWMEQQLDLYLDNHSYALLFDHLIHLLKRLSEGSHIVNYLLEEIQTLYPEAFRSAEKAVQRLTWNSGYEISYDETGFLALHLYAAGRNKTSPAGLKEHTAVLHRMITIMEESLHTMFPRRTLAYEGLINHLNVAVQAAEHKEELMKAPLDMVNMMKEKYPESCEAARQAVLVLKKEKELTIPEDESVYIAMHLQRLLNKKNR
ncbi:PRD domain-containing protein [Salibacterium halotolerans]|uniref:Beta-glucoside operon transcriptional antiterminator n=1 Tax=Salibacterium halotolerans TaxID=1884432 RepID=A0A1I5NSC9_9BACI|nr:PRD domain-containing protein [Salibacterium halotolerans]SFP24683.1 beta-glucoside operon transcriptional antiterminator [Salibacterium halotolerans]